MLSAIRLMVFAMPLILGVAILSEAQTQPLTQNQNTTANTFSRFEYEVASIKPDLSDKTSSGTIFTPDGLTVTNFSLASLIQNAYGIQKYQLSGAPNWLSSESYDVDAKMDAATVDRNAKTEPP